MANFKYKIIEDWVNEEISTGRLTAGDRLPTEPELMEQFSVSRQTVRSAIEHLTDAGILYKVQGSGTYVTDHKQLPAGAPGISSGRLPSLTDLESGLSVAIIVKDSNNYIFQDVLRGASEAFSRNGVSMNIYFTDNNFETERDIIQAVMQQKPGGLIIEPITIGPLIVNLDLYNRLAENIPVLMIHHDSSGPFPALSLRDREAGKIVTEHLLSQGHTQIATIFCLDEDTAYNRYLGFLETMQNHGLKQPDMLSMWIKRSMLDEYMNPEGNFQMEHILKNATALMCHDDRIAYTLTNYLQRKGIRIPEDISIVSYDDSFYATLNIPITSVSHPKERYGYNAALALISMIQCETINLADYEISPSLTVRDSVKCLTTPMEDQ